MLQLSSLAEALRTVFNEVAERLGKKLVLSSANGS